MASSLCIVAVDFTPLSRDATVSADAYLGQPIALERRVLRAVVIEEHAIARAHGAPELSYRPIRTGTPLQAQSSFPCALCGAPRKALGRRKI